MENNDVNSKNHTLYDLPYKGVDWKAVTSGEPKENEQLMELLMKYMPRDELSRIIEDLIREKLELNSDILEAMKAFAKKLETIITRVNDGDGGASDELNEIFRKLADIMDAVDENESTLRDDIDEHSSDFDSHLNDRDRETIDNVEEYREATERMFNETVVVRERVESDRAVLDDQISVLASHMADAAIHSPGVTVRDNLTTQSATDALSANQGHILDTRKLNVTGGALTGQLTAGGNQSVATSQVRNIHAGTDDMQAGVSALATGRIYLVYE